MNVSRRSFLRVAGAGALVVAADATGLWRPPGAAAAPTPTVSPAGLTTMGRTLLPGAARGGGYRGVVAGPGEGHVLRTELTSARPTVTYPIAAFAHLSDLHIIDDQSPSRVE